MKMLYVLMSLTIPFGLSARAADSAPQVCILKIVDHVALDETVRGIRDALAGRPAKILVDSAQGNPTLAMQIGQKFATKNPAVAVAVGTVAAQSLVKYAGRPRDPIPLVYGSVTDPKSAGLLEKENVTGVSNFVPLRPQLQFFRELLPGLSSLGVPYNPGEANSVAIVEALRPICEEMGIGLLLRAATRTAEMPQAAAELARRADALFVSNDNTALAALGAIVAVADGQGIPVFVSDTDAVQLGALAALGPNQREVGRQTGRLIAKILDGTPPDALPPEGVERMELFLNLSTARRLGLTVDKRLVKRAKEVLP